jgi:hypothetical protein
MGPDGREPVVLGEAAVASQRVEDIKAGAWPVDHRDRDGAIKRDDRAWRQRVQEVVELEDLGPVGVGGRRRLGVHGLDRRLQLVGAQPGARQRLLDKLNALLQQRMIPAAAVLFGHTG